MPRYYLDFLDGENNLIDTQGQEFDDDETARLAARKMLAQRAPIEILRGGETALCVRIRQHGTRFIFCARLTLCEEIQRLDS